MKVAEGVSLAYAPLATLVLPLAVDGVALGVSPAWDAVRVRQSRWIPAYAGMTDCALPNLVLSSFIAMT